MPKIIIFKSVYSMRGRAIWCTEFSLAFLDEVRHIENDGEVFILNNNASGSRCWPVPAVPVSPNIWIMMLILLLVKSHSWFCHGSCWCHHWYTDSCHPGWPYWLLFQVPSERHTVPLGVTLQVLRNSLISMIRSYAPGFIFATCLPPATIVGARASVVYQSNDVGDR